MIIDLLGQRFHSVLYSSYLPNHLPSLYQPLSISLGPNSLTHSLQIYCIELTGPTSLYTLGLGANNMSLQCQSILNTYLVIIDQDINKFFFFFSQCIQYSIIKGFYLFSLVQLELHLKSKLLVLIWLKILLHKYFTLLELKPRLSRFSIMLNSHSLLDDQKFRTLSME